MDRVHKVIENLKKRKINAKFFKDRQELIDEIIREIDIQDLVAIGGSMTIEQLNIYDKLLDRGNNVLWHWKVSNDEKMNVLRKAIFSDVYLTSTNALTEDGKIVNIDGVGNRVASMFFGPKKVIMVCGINKICKDYDEAIKRIKEIACPQNARRLQRNVPCAKLDKCMDCTSSERMCMVTSIIQMCPPLIDFKVYILNEEIGY
ncbi:lactate utilization protein [Alkalithermobacter thermoalcaliphilus]